VHVQPRALEIGALNGTPGPCFCAHARVEVTGLRFAALEDRIMVRYADQSWTFRAR
jgi:hypothetical protein